MDLDMFAHPATQYNLDRLRAYGNHIIEPAKGELASRLVGKGRMEEPDEIIRTLETYFSHACDLQKKKILITAGPTYEKIDPVRFIGNYSSGKMGVALAGECARRGAEVTLVTGPVTLPVAHPRICRVDVESAEEMYREAVGCFPACHAAILCAAVADYRVEHPSAEKIKRENRDGITLRLVPNKDIAASLGNMKRDGQLLIGFALETADELENARHKLEKKNLDAIVLNSLREAGAGFRVDTNKITILDRSGRVTGFPLKNKREVASYIVNKMLSLSTWESSEK
jgi:phosphopantothenoylcysteine decarboxylase/phosphopantothenate--cysteine ligase